MNILLFFVAAVVPYFVAGLNPAIILSKAVYHQDIRQLGSGNPGFTNFNRVFGPKLSWLVFVLDIGKEALVAIVFGSLFSYYFGPDQRQLGVAYAAAFAILGHAFPVYYNFKGGKGFLVCMSTIFFLDWRIGIIAFIVLALLILTTRFMSLSTMTCMVISALLLIVVKASPAVVVLFSFCVLFMIYRHRANIKRLLSRTEPKLFSSKKKVS